MGRWVCRKCGEEILVGVSVYDDYNFTVDKDGVPDELYSCFFNSIDDHIRKEHYNFELNYKCPNCDEESDDVEDIAYWEDEEK